MKTRKADNLKKANHSCIKCESGRYIAYCPNRDIPNEWLVMNLSPEQYYAFCNEGTVDEEVPVQLWSFNGRKQIYIGKVQVRTNSIWKNSAKRRFYAICDGMQDRLTDKDIISYLGIKEFIFHNAIC